MITKALLCEWDACYYRNGQGARIDSWFGARAELTLREVAEHPAADLSLDDRLWVLCRALWYLDESAARTFAIDSAALVSHLAGREQDQAEHARLVADLRRIYTISAGAERERELQRWDAARDAAWAAAWDAARDAAWAADWDAARDAAWDAAWAAAWDAARDAAWAADWDAARDAEMRKAIARALAAVEKILAKRDHQEDTTP